MDMQVGGRESLGHTKVYQNNYLRTKRQKDLVYTEVGYLLKYFSDKTLKHPSFFYYIQLDNEEQITNILQADAKMIIDYGQLGDVVSFDTTYKVDKKINHSQFLLYLIIIDWQLYSMYDEIADSFMWLFDIFLKAMSWKSLKMIFIDQDVAMTKVISHVSEPHVSCMTHNAKCLEPCKQCF